MRAGRVHRRRVRGRRWSMHRCRLMRGSFEYRRAVRRRGRRVLDRSRRVLNRGGRVLDRSRRVLDRSGSVVDGGGCVSRLLDHRRAGAAVADGATGAGALDHGPRVRRRRRMATDRATGAAATLNDRGLSARRDWGVLGRDTAGVDRTATTEGRSLLAENLAMGPSANTTGRGATAGSTGRDAATDSARRSAAADTATASATERRTFLAEDAPVRSAGRRTAA
jgi:hypothetical protein